MKLSEEIISKIKISIEREHGRSQVITLKRGLVENIVTHIQALESENTKLEAEKAKIIKDSKAFEDLETQDRIKDCDEWIAEQQQLENKIAELRNSLETIFECRS